MAIVQICESFAYGTANSLMLLIDALADKESNIKIFYALRPGGEEPASLIKREIRPRVEWIEMESTGPLRHLRNLRLILRETKQDDHLLLHGHSTYGGIYAKLAGLFRGKHAFVMYSPRGYAFLREDKSNIARFFFRVFEKLTAKMALTIACGPAEYAVAQALGGDTICISNGTNLVEVTPGGSRKDYFFTAGRICHQKGFDIQKEIARAMPDATFYWAGSMDPGSEQLLEECPPNIKLLGYVSHDDIQTWIADARAILLPSRWEGLSRFLIESIALGKPIVVSDIPQNTDCLMPSNTGYLNGFACRSVEDYVRALKALEDDRLLRSMQKQSRLLAEEQFSQDKINRKWKSLYDSHLVT